MSKSVAVLVILETDDPRLDPDALDVSTAKSVAALRRVVIDNLPQLRRVVMVTSEEDAKLMCQAQDEVARMFGRPNGFPPRDYVPPTRD
jgi:hypothetical protein